jgi:hypothetical protein
LPIESLQSVLEAEVWRRREFEARLASARSSQTRETFLRNDLIASQKGSASSVERTAESKVQGNSLNKIRAKTISSSEIELSLTEDDNGMRAKSALRDIKKAGTALEVKLKSKILQESETTGIQLGVTEPFSERAMDSLKRSIAENYATEMKEIAEKVNEKFNSIVTQLNLHVAKKGSVGLSKFNQAHIRREAARRVSEAIEKKLFGHELSQIENLELRKAVLEEMEGGDATKRLAASISRGKVHEKFGNRQLTFLEDLELTLATHLVIQADQEYLL